MNLTGTNEGGGLQLSSSAQATMQGFLNGGIYGAISAGAGSLLNRFPTPHEDLNKNTLFAANIRNSTSDVLLSSGNPYAMAAGAAVRLIDKTGGFTDASEGLGGTNDTLNTLASLTLPGAGWFTKPIEKYEVSAATKAMKNSYAGTLKDNQKAAKNSGAKILFGRNLATSKIHVGKANDRMIENIKQDSNDDYQTMATMTQSKAMEDQYAYTGGYQQALARAGKFGMKIERAKILAKIDFKPEEKVEGFKLGGVLDVKEFIDTTELLNANFFASLTFDDLPKYQEGGSFETKPTEDTSESKKNEEGLETFKEGGLMNVIPEGNLHARLHHMEDSEKFTQKGIPVIDKDGNLQAEIELNEIIFNLEVTEKLEKMYKSYKDYESNKEKDEVAIQAGKLIAKEIMENTEDRTGLINQVL